MSLRNPYKKDGMFEGAGYLVFQNAKRLRNTMTETELMLWAHIKGGINGLKFRRQHPIGNYIADFFCHKVKLIIEIDGSVNKLPEVKELDIVRQKDLEDLGYYFIKFSNNEIQRNLSRVINIIENTVSKIIKSQFQNASSK